MRVLLVTNDFPPRVGGIQSYLWNIYRRLAATENVDVRVLAPAFPGDASFDATSGIEIIRWPGTMMWPTPALERRIRRLAHDADVVAFGAVLPLNLLGPRLDRPTVVHTHGFEVAWARLPALRSALRRIARSAAVVTVISDFTRRFIERALGEDIPTHMLRTGVDLDRFTPDADGAAIRKRFGLDGRPVIACVSRLVLRKGQDQLIKALPLVHREVPDAAALIVGDGPARSHLERLARHHHVENAVVFAGEAPEAELPAHYAAGDVFAMPCRSRFAGLEVEGLGLVYLEAQACARPAITGDSGGAPEAVIPNQTGFVVPGRDPRTLATRLTRFLSDPLTAHSMGQAARTFVEQTHHWNDVVTRYHTMLLASI